MWVGVGVRVGGVGVLLPLLYLIPIALVTRYQITQAVHASIRAELDRRRKAES